MKKLLFLLVGFAFICTVRATVDDDLMIKGLPVKVVSSGKSYKVFEQYPWEGHSSNYGPKGNHLSSGYGVGVSPRAKVMGLNFLRLIGMNTRASILG